MRRLFFSSGKSPRKFHSPGILRPYLVSTIIPVLFLAVIVALSLGAVVRGSSLSAAQAAAGASGASSGMDRGLGGRLAPEGDYPKLQMSYSEVELAASVDLSGQLPPIGDQGAQNSCVAWASGYYYKSWSEGRKHSDPAWDLTNTWYQYSPSFVYNQINGGVDKGSSFPDAFGLLESKGDTDIAYMPYNPADFTTQPNAKQNNAALPYRISPEWGSFWSRNWAPFPGYLTPNNINDVKAWLDSGKVLVMLMPIYQDFPDYGGNPSSQYYVYDGVSTWDGGHGVTICGYDDNINPGGADADHKGGFLMANSWGPAWNGADNGYVYLSYDFVKRYVPEAWWMTDTTSSTPVVSSFVSEGDGDTGDTLHIYGDNFGTYRRNARVSFNGIDGTGPVFTNQEISVTVPAGDVTGALKVFNWDGEASEAVSYPCTYYFAEGYTGGGFEEWLCLMNPNPDPTTAHITYMFEDGTTQLQDVNIGATTRKTIFVNDEVGPDKNVSLKVEADDSIVAERPIYFDYKGMWNGGHDVVGYAP